MSDLNTKKVECKLLELLQTGFPFSREPYYEMGLEIGLSGAEIIRCISGLKQDGIVRQISPVMDARMLGYSSTLVGMKVAKEVVGRAGQLVREHPGISHGYERDNVFNIWVTLSARSESDIVVEMQRLASEIGADAIVNLPAIKVFKLRTNFSTEDNSRAEAEALDGFVLPGRAVFSELEREVINELQQDLPLTPDPFNIFAQHLNIPVESLLDVGQTLIQRRVIRRYGASINHYRAGYSANAMTCWRVTADRVEEIATRLALLKQVSHCYERVSNSSWTYNLFAMLHAGSRSDVQEIVKKIAAETELTDYAVLYSVKELKKARIRYPV